MTDFREAQAAMPPDPFLNAADPETPDEVFAVTSDLHRRYNTAWRQAQRESQEGSP